jgi:hypothetical protein
MPPHMMLPAPLRFVTASLVLVLLLLLPMTAPAMGDFGGEGALTRIPEPSLSYRVRVTDTEMNAFEVVKASFDGHIYLTGTVGKARVSVPFDRIKKVIFEPLEGNQMLAVVTLVDGKQQPMQVSARTPCFGLADFGNVSIDLGDLRDATFLGRADAVPSPAP